LRDRRDPNVEDGDKRHERRIGPAPADEDVEPLAENRVSDAYADGDERDPKVGPRVERPPPIAGDNQREDQSGRSDQYVAACAMKDREEDLARRRVGPDRVERQMRELPDQIAESDAQKVTP
jgi:hypothetical protein